MVSRVLYLSSPAGTRRLLAARTLSSRSGRGFPSDVLGAAHQRLFRAVHPVAGGDPRHAAGGPGRRTARRGRRRGSGGRGFLATAAVVLPEKGSITRASGSEQTRMIRARSCSGIWQPWKPARSSECPRHPWEVPGVLVGLEPLRKILRAKGPGLRGASLVPAGAAAAGALRLSRGPRRRWPEDPGVVGKAAAGVARASA